VKGFVYDVSLGRTYYGPDGPQALFAGRDASRLLAKGTLNPVDVINTNISDLSAQELEMLDASSEWFRCMYQTVGCYSQTRFVLLIILERCCYIGGCIPVFRTMNFGVRPS